MTSHERDEHGGQVFTDRVPIPIAYVQIPGQRRGNDECPSRVLVEADYRMKLIGIGLEPPPVDMPTYIRMQA